MAQSQMRVEIGSWVEGTTPKKDGKGMRKVWVAGNGDAPRLAVLAGERDTHVVTLYVGTPEQRALAREALTLALAGLDALEAPKAPTPITRNPAPDAKRAQVIAKAREERAALSVGKPKPASEDGANWFAKLMHEAGAV